MNRTEQDQFERDIGLKKNVGETNLAFKRRKKEEGTLAGKVHLIVVFIFFFGVIFLFAFASDKRSFLNSISNYISMAK